MVPKISISILISITWVKNDIKSNRNQVIFEFLPVVSPQSTNETDFGIFTFLPEWRDWNPLYVAPKFVISSSSNDFRPTEKARILNRPPYSPNFLLNNFWRVHLMKLLLAEGHQLIKAGLSQVLKQEGVIPKEMILVRSTSILSYSATTRLA